MALDDKTLQKWEKDAGGGPISGGGLSKGGLGRGDFQSDVNAQGGLAQAAGDYDYVKNAQDWYTGANPEGLGNSWNTAFKNQYFEEYDKAAAENRLSTFFSDGGTGVVTYDHDGYKFGDVVQKGVVVSNVYDDFSRTEEADLAMSAWMPDAGEALRRIWGNQDPDERARGLRQLVQEWHDENNVNVPKALEAADFEAGRAEREEGWREDHGAETKSLIAGGGALASAGIGATAGTFIGGPIGTAVGGVGGFLFGGAAALLNQDAIIHQASRAAEVTEKAREKNSAFGATAAVSEWSRFGLNAMDPLRNLVQGSVDAAGSSRVGDSEADFYKVDDEGKRTTSFFVRALDVGAAAGTALLTFGGAAALRGSAAALTATAGRAAPLGTAAATAQNIALRAPSALFTGEMAAATLGEAGTLAQGQKFDDRSGGYVDIWRDPKDDSFDAASGAAAWASVGIDAVQLGMIRGLATRARGEQRLIAGAEASASGASAATSSGSKLMRWARGEGGLKEGERIFGYGGGRRIIQREDGTLRSTRTLSWVAPSNVVEAAAGHFVARGKQMQRQLQAATAAKVNPGTSADALVKAAASRAQGGVYMDDYYTAVMQFAAGEKKLQSAVVNGFGEMVEELTQSVLDPISTHSKVDPGAIGEAMLYGFATGAGMAAGTAIHAPSQADRLYYQASMAQMAELGTPMPRADFDAMSPQQQRVAASRFGSKMESAFKEVARHIQEDQAMQAVDTVADWAKVRDAQAEDWVAQLKKANPKLDTRVLLTGVASTGAIDPTTGEPLPGEAREHSATMSAPRLMQTMLNKEQAARRQAELLADRIKELKELLADPEISDTDEVKAQAAADLAAANAEMEHLTLVVDFTEQVQGIILGKYREFANHMKAGRERAAKATLATLNERLETLAAGTGSLQKGVEFTPAQKLALSEAVTLYSSRSPIDASSSIPVFVPRVSFSLTTSEAHGQVQVSHSVLEDISGDFDGDYLGFEAMRFSPDGEAFKAVRAGAARLGAGKAPIFTFQHYSKRTLLLMEQAISEDHPLLADKARDTLAQIASAIESHLQDRVPAQVLEPVMAAFRTGGPTVANFETLLLSLSQEAGAALLASGWDALETVDGALQDSKQWIFHVMVSSLEEFQSLNAVTRAVSIEQHELSDAPDQTAEVIRQRKKKAAQPGIDLALHLSAEQAIRPPQAVHYGALRSIVDSAKDLEPGQLQELAVLFAELTSGITQSELDRVSGHEDEITAKAEVMLERLRKAVADETGVRYPLALFANMRVRDVSEVTDRDGLIVYKQGPEISMVQLVLKRALAAEEAALSGISAQTDEKVEARFSALRKMTRAKAKGDKNKFAAHRAFQAVFGHKTLIDLLGASLGALPGHITLNQLLSQVMTKSKDQRTAWAALARMQPEYGTKKKGETDLPFRLSQARDGDDFALPFRSIVETVMALAGEHSDRLRSESKQGQASMQTLLGNLVEMIRVGSKNLDAEMLQGKTEDERLDIILAADTTFARDLRDIIPNKLVSVVYETRTDPDTGKQTLHVASWFKKAFTIKDPAEAEWHVLKNLLLSMKARHDQDLIRAQREGKTAKNLRAFDRINSRFVQTLYYAAYQEDNGMTMRRILSLMDSSKTTDEFYEALNKEPVVQAFGPPLLPYRDDVSDYSADKSQGGWGQSGTMRELTIRLRELAESSKLALQAIDAEHMAWKKDEQFVTDAATGYARQAAGETLTTAERDAVAAVDALIEQAEVNKVGLGIHAMVNQASRAAYGLENAMQTKADSPLSRIPGAEFDIFVATVDGWNSSPERMWNAMASHSLDDVVGHLHEAAQGPFWTMDDDGRPIYVQKLTGPEFVRMYKDPTTRNLARKFALKTVMETNASGDITPKLMHGLSLTDQTSKAYLSDLFVRDSSKEGVSRHTDEANYRYTMELSARAAARAGSNHTVTEAIDSIAIARTSAALRPGEDPEALARGAIQDNAEFTRALASYLSGAGLEGAELEAELERLHETILLMAEIDSGLQRSRNLLLQSREGRMAAVETVEREAWAKHVRDIDELSQRLAASQEITDPAERQAVLEQIQKDHAAANLVYSAVARGAASLLDASKIDTVQESYMLSEEGTDPEDDFRREMIEGFAVGHQHELRARFPKLTAGILNRVLKAAGSDAYADEPGTASLKDYQEVGARIISMIMASEGPSGPNYLGLVPYPRPASPQNHWAQDTRKYWDSTFGYLVAPVFDRQTGILDAALEIQKDSKQNQTTVTMSQLLEIARTTVMDRRKLGTHTPEIIALSNDNAGRLKSATGKVAVPAYGNIIKRISVLDAATRFTTKVPGDEMLSGVSLSKDQLDPEVSPLFYSNKTGGTEATMVTSRIARLGEQGWAQAEEETPLAALNNRFVKKARLFITDKDGNEYQVTQTSNIPAAAGSTEAAPEDDFLVIAGRLTVGAPWLQEPTPRPSGLYEVTLARLRTAVDRYLTANNLQGSDYRIELDYLHMDSIPPDDPTLPTSETWMHNVYLEGAAFDLAGGFSQFHSHFGAAWVATGGINQLGQRQAIDSVKGAKTAYTTIERLNADELETLEKGWDTDFAGMLHRKTARMMTAEFDIGRLSPTLYNSMYKAAKMRNWVAGRIDGKAVLWTAEQVVAWQKANPGENINTKLEGATLWRPSMPVLSTMLGDTLGQGVPTQVGPLGFNPAEIEPFTGYKPSTMERFAAAALDPRRLEDTRAAGDLSSQSFQLRPYASQASRAAYDRTVEYQRSHAQPTYQARLKLDMDKTARWNTFTDEAADMFSADALVEVLAEQFGGPVSGELLGSTDVTEEVATRLQRVLETRPESAPFVLRRPRANDPSSFANPNTGVINPVDLTSKGLEKNNPAYRPVHEDPVAVDVESFYLADATAEESIRELLMSLDYLVSVGAFIILTGAHAQPEVRYRLRQHLKEQGYTPLAGDAFQPAGRIHKYQNAEARTAMLFDGENRNTRNYHLVFLDNEGLVSAENSIMWNLKSGLARPVGLSVNMAPGDYLADYNFAEDLPWQAAQTDTWLQQVLALDTPRGRAQLRKMAGIPKKAKGKRGAIEKLAGKAANVIEFDKALDHMFARARKGKLLPENGEKFGTGSILPMFNGDGGLVLYRHGYKAPEDARGDMLKERVSVYQNELEPQSTTHLGRWERMERSARFGSRIHLRIDFDQLGDKKQFQWAGMKFTDIALEDETLLPDYPMVGNIPVAGISDLESTLSKEATRGTLTNYREQIAMYGFDFLPIVARTVFHGDGPKELMLARELLNLIEKAGTFNPDHVDRALRAPGSLRAMLSTLDTLTDGKVAVPQKFAELDVSTAEAEITAILMTYLMADGASVDRVLASGRQGNPDKKQPGLRSLWMDSLFTDALDQASDNVHDYMLDRFRKAINPNPKADGTGYELQADGRIMVTTKDRKGKMRTRYYTPMFNEMHSSGDNPAMGSLIFDGGATEAISAHDAATVFAAVGLETLHVGKKPLNKDPLKSEGPIAELRALPADSTDVVGSVMDLFGASANPESPDVSYRMRTPGEMFRVENGKKVSLLFRHALDPDVFEGEEFDGEPAAEVFSKLVTEIRKKLNLSKSQEVLVHYWIRQVLGMPVTRHTWSRVFAQDAIEGAQHVLSNVEAHRLPVHNGRMPFMHAADLHVLYAANNNPRGWKISDDPDNPDGKELTSWQSMVNAAFASVLTERYEGIDPIYKLAIDGTLQSYAGATDGLLTVPASMSHEINAALMDKNNQLVVSFDKHIRQSLAEPAFLDSQNQTLDSILGSHTRASTGLLTRGPAPSGVLARRGRRVDAWAKAQHMPRPETPRSPASLNEQGDNLIQGMHRGQLLALALSDARAGLALFNPALYFSAFIENRIRSIQDDLAGLLAGTSTGVAARGVAKVTEATGVADVAERAGFELALSSDHLKQLHGLYKVMGERNDFAEMVWKGLVYLKAHHRHPANWWATRWLESFAAFASRLQDPATGMRADRLARTYVEAVIRHINAMPSVNPVSMDTLIANLYQDPLWVEKMHPEASAAGMHAIAQMRSLKDTTLMALMRPGLEKITNTSSTGFNFASTVTLKLPLMFAGYGLNVATTVTGLQGVDSMLAMWLHNRKKFWATGDTEAAYLDTSAVLEGIDLSHAIIRSGVTLTGLFQLGLMMGGLGLAGDDEEMRRRKRAAELQGSVALADPSKLGEDFANADALFLDFLPAPLEALFRAKGQDKDSQTLVRMHWMVNQFVGPLLGMSRFFESGDFKEVIWGFESALLSFPLVNENLYSQTMDTVSMLAATAKDVERTDQSEEATLRVSKLLSSMVWSLESMLMESSFANAIYAGRDEFDRDPYVLPALTDEGGRLVDANGNPLETDELVTYLDEEGNVKQGYRGRTPGGIELRTMTEQRFSAALLSSLVDGISGGGNPFTSDYWRRNMVPKVRKFDKPVTTKKEAKQALYSALIEKGGYVKLDLEEAENIIRQNLEEATGSRWGHDAQVKAMSQDMVEAAEAEVGMSLPGKNGEVLTKKGALAIFRGLQARTVSLSDSSLAGIYIPQEMREEIMREWRDQLVREGISMGLQEWKAKARMNRIWYGNDGSNGLHNLVWSKEISSRPYVEYQQLNSSYTAGPNGMPYATGFERGGILSAFGLDLLHKPLQPVSDRMGQDTRMNSVDRVLGMNTGRRALVPIEEPAPKPPKPGKDDAQNKDYDSENTRNGGYKGYYRRGGYSRRRRSGGGYSGGGGGYANWTNMYTLPQQRALYGQDIPFINTSNPIIRRATVRRERVWSERGRLKQWQ